ncbi:MAG TPA: tripartite tricarboxylate transporter substrate-binding protein [Alphaproteobacteria bacterium]|nr:tripartite tricarboxylate transporter substrate-binding protein [Alphaproteobacteria bacterium]
MMVRTGLLAAVALASLATPAAAQSVAEFYQGKSVDVVVGSGAGGGYDIYARLLARRMGEYIPGKPTLIVKNVVGGGGIRAATLLYNVSPKDGSVIATVSRAMITAPALGVESAKFDASKFTWLGNLTGEDSVCISWHTTPVKTWDDMLKNKLIVGTAAPGTSTYTFPALLKNMFGAKFDMVTGYPDASQAVLALERGEVQAICQTFSTIKANHPSWIKDGTANVLTVVGMRRNADIPDVPATAEFAKTDEQRQIIKIILGPELIGRPFFAPPGLPADRTAALRDAFTKVAKDKDFLADAARQNLEVDPTGGQAIQDMIADILSAPPAMMAKAQAMLAKE